LLGSRLGPQLAWAQQRPERGAPGTFDRLVQDYFSSPDFKRLAQSTQRAYRFVIERLVRDEKIGHRLVSEMKRERINRIGSTVSAGFASARAPPAGRPVAHSG
jgi:hypothetical protein